MSVSVSQWVTVTEAAQVGKVSERTLWRWIHAGTVESRAEKRGQRETRLVNLISLPPAGSEAGESVSDRQRPTATDSETASESVHVGRCQSAPDSSVSHCQSVSDSPVSHCQPVTDTVPEDGLTGCPCCPVKDRERETLAADVDFLRAQLDHRTEELQRHAIAEEQLRVMLMKLAATNAELAGALMQKALPPAPAAGDSELASASEAPGARKTRRWQLWR